MTFMSGKDRDGRGFDLHVLEGTDDEARQWSRGVNSGLTTEHLFTGSIPMRWIDAKERWRDERDAGSVELKICVGLTKNIFIGTVGLYSHRDIYRSWEFRILIFDPQAVGRGVGTAATRLVVDYGFRRLNAHRIWLGVSSANLRAVACYEKVGFQKEGILRDEIFYDGSYHHAIRMSLLEDEWKSIVPSSSDAEESA